METVLKNFITKSLFEASCGMLDYLHIKFSPQSKSPVDFGDLYVSATSRQMPGQLSDVMAKVEETYFIGTIDDESLNGNRSAYDLEAKPADEKYDTMMVFAVEIKPGQSLTRTEIAVLTRGFNRIASSFPVILFVKNGNRLSLATCERSDYQQSWREGEKLGKVSILRDINLEHPHRGHRDILETLGDKAYSTFEDLYKHWLDVFSSELLTKKFYTELSEWYAWVIGSGKVKFPNNIRITEDDTKYNHEAVIRLITRLIFVWFLKQKKLIPNEFFDENAIRENFIEDFDPHSENTLFYNPEESKYYRLILQNLFFAMLNRPIKDEETGNDENRRFVRDRSFQGKREDFNINNLLRYRSEFKKGGADKLLELANQKVPFLNGGLFECLDHKDKDDPEYGMYFDGFTENSVARKQLSFPDYFFFGEEVGSDVDLSKWYDDKKKTHSKVRGIINILQHYNFTVEENTPLDQEVSLDPELLGKAFENLLASYNPETQTTARKQTGSFYTPRPIVQYMVDESLIAHLKRSCPEIDESVFRNLFDYSVDSFDLPESDRKEIMRALHNCKVLDPACGSGAFPMGMLQQMVHALRKLDPSNEMWKEFILELALGKDREAYLIQDDEERKSRRRDIEEAFNRNVNDPDYARKLYIIENCIFGVDIQPIAVQISKLRFFISLVAEQKPNYDDPLHNFGIRPLPNLEAKFIAANSLISLKKEHNIFVTSDKLLAFKKHLSELNHKLFLTRRNSNKRKLKNLIKGTRDQYSKELMSMGAVGPSSAALLADWNMFEQNKAASFFDAQWMFGINNGFDIVIANPPYVSTKGVTTQEKKQYEEEFGFSDDLYNLFTFKGMSLCADGGSVTFITPKTFWTIQTKRNMRDLLLSHNLRYVYDTANPFEAVMVDTCMWQVIKTKYNNKRDNEVNFIDGSSNLENPIVFNPIKQSVYLNTQNAVIFKPTELNLKIWNLYGEKIKKLYDRWWNKIKTSRDIEKNKAELEAYRKSLKPGDIALLGCLTEGGVGIQTGNNGKYIAVRRSTKWAKNIEGSRPKKLADVIAKYKPVIPGYSKDISVSEFLSTMSEKEIADLFDTLKEKYGRDIFGQGYLYRIINDDEMADVSTLTKEEKENGIDSSKKVYVPYDKGDKDGNRWYLETPFAIAWSKENVRYLKTNSGKKGQGMPVVRNPQFYFREGFCWIDVNSTYLKARIKTNGVFDVLSMSLFTMTYLPDWYFVALINSEFISLYVDNFINNTSHFQINDARQLPIIIPQKGSFDLLQNLVTDCIKLKKVATTNDLLMGEKQCELDGLVRLMYGVE